VNGQLHALGALPLGKEPPVPIGQGAGWTPEPVWTTLRRENSWPYWDSNSDPSVVQPVANRYTDCAILDPKNNMKLNVKRIQLENVNWFHLTHKRDEWQALVTSVMKRQGISQANEWLLAYQGLCSMTLQWNPYLLNISWNGFSYTRSRFSLTRELCKITWKIYWSSYKTYSIRWQNHFFT
jgi:hypothetical protein